MNARVQAQSGALDVIERVDRLVAEMREPELDVLLVATPVNVRYLTGFTGSNALLLIAADAPAGGLDGPGFHRFLTDFRYASQSADQVPDVFAREIVYDKLLDARRASA